ncbi:methyltransferase domain-containing protein [Micromonospora endolithica]|uniref:Methyltransferase domain-containing protein n=1 Tax=Micromonospora endolithica TaxID=230091 RepID=A0A3A9ZIF9_9ACTN|nr:methyltransferase domain-containing protein [Micromonospora endolithica]RKN47855.1 methyltransferase domain-containing protein [Micromonospora endolithica]TWJ21551.1 methyltransferase family protein [Micromonospora endolithica]
MTVDLPADFADWLALREPADAAARAADLADAVRHRVTGGPLTVHDLGSGTGSMARWLAPLLPGPQHWILHDQDADLLARAAAAVPGAAADGAPVTVTTRRGDLTRLTAADLADADLVTASALLDMLTAEEVDRLVAACAGRRTLFALSVTGRVALTPADPLDAEVAAAFNAHQRRRVGGRTLLGPDAADAAAAAFARHGVDVLTRPSPWRLGPEQAALATAWFTGWLAAAREQRPDLAEATRAYADRRRAELAAGELRVLVDHRDLLAGG